MISFYMKLFLSLTIIQKSRSKYEFCITSTDDYTSVIRMSIFKPFFSLSFFWEGRYLLRSYIPYISIFTFLFVFVLQSTSSLQGLISLFVFMKITFKNLHLQCNECVTLCIFYGNFVGKFYGSFIIFYAKLYEIIMSLLCIKYICM